MPTVNQMLTRNIATVFRRLSIRRRLNDSSGNYETSWFDISNFVKKWGTLESSIDDINYSVFRQRGISILVANDNGEFDRESNVDSLWNGYLTRYKTLVRIECGFTDPDTLSDIPPKGATDPASTSTQFIGVMTEAVRLNGVNDAVLNVKSLSSILEEIPANMLVVASAGGAGSGQLTASDLIARMRDVTDGSANFISRKFITSTAWTIEATSLTLTSLDTTTALDGFNCWSLAAKLAESSNKSVYITKLGGLRFVDKTAATTVSFIFSGAPFNNSAYGHTIKALNNVEEDYNILFNRIRIKFNSKDTSTSYKVKEEGITVGGAGTSWKYGVRTLEFQNTFMDSLTADNVASTLLGDLNVIKNKVNISCKFIPTLNLLDRTRIELDTPNLSGSRWNQFNWNEADWTKGSSPIRFNISDEYKIIKVIHDLDRLETNVVLRGV